MYLKTKFLIVLFTIISLNVVFAQIPCNTWLRLPDYNETDYVTIGDLSISGN
jgi:hypothetical protein